MSRSHKYVANVKKIAVLRANALGDFIFALPALDALRQSYPHAEITLLGKSWHEMFLRDRPGPVDRIIVLPPIGGVGEPGSYHPTPEVVAFLERLRSEHFDLALQLHGGGRNSNTLIQAIGARLTAGARTDDAPALDRWIPYVYYQPEAIRYLEIARLVGATTTDLQPRLPVTPSDHAVSEQAVKSSPRPIVVLHPGASDPRRRWAPARFARIGDHLVSAIDAHVVITGQSAEQPLADQVAHDMRAPAQVVTDLTLGGLAGLLSRTRLVISNDTGPLHLAQAVGAPTVGLYWCSNFITALPMTVRKHRAAIAWTTHCPVCASRLLPFPPPDQQCDHLASLIDTITVDEVMTHIASSLAQP